MKNVTKHTKLTGIVMSLAAAACLLIGSTPTQAVDWSRPSRTDNWYGSYTANYPVPRATNYPNGWVKDHTAFYMHCWTDHAYFNGNYGSARWFYGYNGYWGYVHSSYVYNQIGVPHC